MNFLSLSITTAAIYCQDLSCGSTPVQLQATLHHQVVCILIEASVVVSRAHTCYPFGLASHGDIFLSSLPVLSKVAGVDIPCAEPGHNALCCYQ